MHGARPRGLNPVFGQFNGTRKRRGDAAEMRGHEGAHKGQTIAGQTIAGQIVGQASRLVAARNQMHPPRSPAKRSGTTLSLGMNRLASSRFSGVVMAQSPVCTRNARTDLLASNANSAAGSGAGVPVAVGCADR